MPADNISPSFTHLERSVGRRAAATLWVFCAALLATVAAWIGQSPVA